MIYAPGNPQTLRSLVLVFLFLFPSVVSAASLSPQDSGTDPASTVADAVPPPLRRIPDPVFITGSSLPAGFSGAEIRKSVV